MSTEALDQIEPQPINPAPTSGEQPVQTNNGGTYNPFLVNVNEKPYAQMNVNATQQQIYTPIPEPTFQTNTVSGNENAYSMLNGEMGMGATAPNQGGGAFNPSMNGLPDADKKQAAEQMAKMLVDGYGMIKGFANYLIQIPTKKLKKLESEGEIDLSVQIPYDHGQTISAGEFVQQFNEQNKDTVSLSKEFKKEVTPVLARVLEKRGVGLTDEQLLGYLFIKDAAITGVQIYQARSTANDMIEVIKEYTAALKANGGAYTPPPPQQETAKQATPPPPPPPAGQQFQEPPHDSSDFNFQSNETFADSAVQRHVVPESGKARLMARKKRDAEIKAAMERAEKLQGDSQPAKPQVVKSAYDAAIASKKTGKRGRKPKDYLTEVDEAKIADAIVLSETPRVEPPTEGIDEN